MPSEDASGVTAPGGVAATDRELIWLLRGLAADIGNSIEDALTAHGLTGPQFGVLQRLRMTGPCAMRDLAAHLHCDASNITGLADRLERRGLLQRQADPHDRRVKQLVLTDAGTVAADDVWEAAVARSAIIGLPQAVKDTLREALRSAPLRHPTAVPPSPLVGAAPECSHEGRWPVRPVTP